MPNIGDKVAKDNVLASMEECARLVRIVNSRKVRTVRDADGNTKPRPRRRG